VASAGGDADIDIASVTPVDLHPENEWGIVVCGHDDHNPACVNGATAKQDSGSLINNAEADANVAVNADVCLCSARHHFSCRGGQDQRYRRKC
jgi:hypothetical protein